MYMHVHVLYIYNWQNQCEGGPATVGQLRPLEVGVALLVLDY